MNENFYNMRKFHNNIKRELLKKYAYNVNNLLDLACGKGGDLKKWYDYKIKNVSGYDINNYSIDELNRRLNNMKNKISNFNLNVKVFKKDLCNSILSGNNEFDVVTCMFGFHYFFKNKNTFETIIKTIKNNLKKNGIFIGVIFDGESVRNLLNTKKNWNENFIIKEINIKNGLLFGNEISVSLKNTVLNEATNEFIIDFDLLKMEMKQRGFELVETRMFNSYKNLNKNNLNDTEKECSFLNRSFVFSYTS